MSGQPSHARSALASLSLSAVVAGFVAVLVGFTSSVVIVFQAAAALGATAAQTASWIWALGLGMGLTSLGLSLWYRQPVLTAWSTPGAALLVTAGAGVPMAEAVGAVAAGAVWRLCAELAAITAAITAAISMGREAHEDPSRRWLASAAAGLFHIIVGLMGGAVVGLIAAFPKELVLAVAGLALLGTIGSGLAVAMKDDSQREAALITFVVSASGLTLWGVGAAFWGVVAVALALAVQRWRS